VKTPELEAINSVRYLFLRELSEPKDNSLRIVVEEAVVNEASRGQIAEPSLPELAEILKGAAYIESTDGCRIFEILWDHYVAYLVTEECVGSCGKHDDEEFTGKLFRTYSKSHFLELLAKDTGGHFEPVVHHKLVCENHIIDVASVSDPAIHVIETT